MEQSFEEKKKKQREQHEENKRKLEIDYKKKIALEQTRNSDLATEQEKEYSILGNTTFPGNCNNVLLRNYSKLSKSMKRKSKK